MDSLARFFALFIFCTTAVSAANAAETNSASYRPLDHLWMGTRDIPNTQNAYVFAAGGVLTLGALALDHSVRDFFTDHDRMGGWDKGGNDYLGTGIPGAVIGLGCVGLGLLTSDPQHLNAGEAHLEGLLATFAYTSVLKFSVRRQRPNSSNRLSFPSGHASTTFASAASLMDMYGPKAGVPALVLAGYTAVSRLNTNAHWLSDVIFGATLGYIVGHAYTLHHQDGARNDEAKIAVWPYFTTRDDFGLHLRWGLL